MKTTILRECVRLARKKNPSLDNQFRHFSFIVQRNKLVEWGTNVPKADPLTFFGYSNISGVHAETNAYAKAKGILDKNYSFEVVNIRLNKSGDLKLSKPCACCYSFLESFGCSTVWFSTEAGFAKLMF